MSNGQSPTQNRVRGVLVGLAAGDRIGGPLQMATLLAQSLNSLGNYEPKDVMDRYMGWYRKGAFDTGRVAKRVFELIDKGTAPKAASEQVHDDLKSKTAGINPAHRAAPLSMLYGLDGKRLAEAARTEAAQTHTHPLAGEAAAFISGTCRQLIDGADLEAAISREISVVDSSFTKLLDSQNEPSAGGFSPEAVQAALHFLRDSSDFAMAMTKSIQFAGRSNYCPVLVGALGGALWGRTAIPSSELGHVKNLDAVEKLASSLADSWD